MRIGGRSAESIALLVAAFIALTSVPLTAQDGQWLMYSGSYSAHRFSPLGQIAAANVARLRPVWVYQPPGTGSVECTPIVANGVMYLGTQTHLYAIAAGAKPVEAGAAK